MLIGFGVLCFAEHSTLRSVGIISLCGIGYSFLGTILLLPPLLEIIDYLQLLESLPLACKLLVP